MDYENNPDPLPHFLLGTMWIVPALAQMRAAIINNIMLRLLRSIPSTPPPPPKA